MTQTKVEIIVSGDNAVETIEQLTSQLPAGTTIVNGTQLAERPATIDNLLEDAIIASTNFPDRIGEWIATLHVTPISLVSISAAIFIAAFLIERLLGLIWGMLTARQVQHSGDATSPIDSITRGLVWGGRQLTLLIVFYIICRVAIGVFLPQDSSAAAFANKSLTSVIVFRVWALIVRFLAAAGAPERRPTGLTDDEAALVVWRSIPIFILSMMISFVGSFALSAVGESATILAIVCRGIAVVLIGALFIAIRKPIGRLIVLGFAADREHPGSVILVMQKLWPAIYILLLILQFLVDTKSYLSISLTGDGAGAVQRSFGAFVIAPFLVAGFRIWSKHLRRDAEPKTKGRILGIFSLLEGAVIIGTGIFIMYAWNIDPFATDLTGARRILPGLVSAAIVTVIGISLWRTASALLIDGKHQEGEAEGGPPEDEGGAGGSRIETVLPVIRAVSAAFIAIVTVLLALSSLGVQIAPLLAGAGILGLAIGFGAQKVVEDVISGVLYLIEDAFRKGEYIETAQGKGVVEAIMLRSVRLRHHLGPVFTIPFSAMGTIQNHSRDWVTVKLKFEVSPDQDLEKVRKLIKKVGQQLLEDPELEGQFLAPLKSQGAVALVGANYQIGVKFTSEPGKQFLIRRKALNAIQKAFSENGIEMAAPRVIVDAQDHDQIAAAAAKVLTDAQAQTPSAQADDR